MNTNTLEVLTDYKMNCEEIRDLSSEYIDSSCDNIESMAIKKHIALCNNCSDFIEDMKQLNVWSRSLSNTEIPQDVASRLRQKLGLS